MFISKPMISNALISRLLKVKRSTQVLVWPKYFHFRGKYPSSCCLPLTNTIRIVQRIIVAQRQIQRSSLRQVEDKNSMSTDQATDANHIISLVKCADFAAIKHRDQRRKDKEETPYINHPIGRLLLWFYCPLCMYVMCQCDTPLSILSSVIRFFVNTTKSSYELVSCSCSMNYLLYMKPLMVRWYECVCAWGGGWSLNRAVSVW